MLRYLRYFMPDGIDEKKKENSGMELDMKVMTNIILFQNG